MKKLLAIVVGSLILTGCTVYEGDREQIAESEEAMYGNLEVKIPEGEVFYQFYRKYRDNDMIITKDTVNNIYKVYSFECYSNSKNITLKLAYIIR